MKNGYSKKEFAKDAFALTLSALIVKIIGVIYKVPLSYMLSNRGMGYFNSAYTVFGCFYVVCAAGVPKAISIIISEAKIKNEKSCEAILRYTLKIFILIGTLFGGFLFFFAGPLSRLVGNGGAFASIASISFSLCFISVSGVMRGYLNGMGRQIPIAVCELIEASIKLIFGLFFAGVSIKIGLDLELCAALSICGISLGAAISAAFLYICIGRKGKTGTSFDIPPRLLSRILKISAPIAMSAFLTSVTNLIDLSFTMHRLVKIGYSEELATTLYGNYTTLAVPFLGLCIALVSPISTAALPKLTSAFIKSDKEEFSTIFNHAISLSAFLGAGLCFGCMYFSSSLLSLIFPDESASLAAPYLTMLSPSFILSGILICVNTALEASGRTTAPLFSMGIGAGVKVVFSYILIGDKNIGIGGAAIGTVLFYASALSISLIMLFSEKRIKIRIFMPIIRHITFALAAALCAKTIQELTKMQLNSLENTLLCGCIYAILYLILSRNSVFGVKKRTTNCENAQKEKRLLLKHT